MGRFETGTLPSSKNLTALANLNGAWTDRVQRLRRSPNLILDIDSSESPVHGEQEASAYNGHFGGNCYHPLFVFDQHGDLERCALRPGNVHIADDWRVALDPVINRYRWSGLWRRYLRGDAAFAIPKLFDYLEANDFGYAIRLKANKVLERRINLVAGVLHADAELHPKSWTIGQASTEGRQDRGKSVRCCTKPNRIGKSGRPCQYHVAKQAHLGDIS